MATADTARLVASLDLKDNLSKGIASALKSVDKLDKTFGRTQKSLGKFGRNFEKGLVLGATAAAGGFALVVNAARDYETAFAGVRKTVDATEPELNALSDAIRQMAREIPISAVELAGLGEAAGALGIAKGDIQEFIRVTALIGVTTDVAAGDAATALGTLSNILGLVGTDYDNFAAALVDLGNKGSSTESAILSFTERIAGAGKLIGLSAADVLGFSAALANAGLEAEAGGSAISRFFLESFKDVSQGGKDLKLLAKLAGSTAEAFQKAFKEDAAGALEDVLVGMGKLSEAERLTAIEALGFTDIRIRDTLLRLTGDTNNLTSSLNTSGTAWKENTALQIEAKKRFETFDSQLKITKQTLTDIGITIGSKLLPKISPLLTRLNDFVNNNQAGISKFGDDLATAFEKAANAIGKVDWQPFIDGLKFTADGVKFLFDVFRSMPADIQKLIVAGVAINKVTGGLITSLAKDVGGAALKLVFERGASPANPLFVKDIGGGLGGAGGVGGKGSALATAGTAITGAAIIGALQAAAKEALVAGTKAITGSDVTAAKAGAISPIASSAFGPPILNTLEAIERVLAGDNRTLLERIADEEGGVRTGVKGVQQGLVSAVSQLRAASDRTKDDTVAAVNRGAEIQKAAASHNSAVQVAAIKTANQQAAFLIRDKVGALSAVVHDGDTRSEAAITRAAAAQQAKLEAIRAAEVNTKGSIDRKDLSVEVHGSPISVNVRTSVGSQIKSQATFKKAGNVFAL